MINRNMWLRNVHLFLTLGLVACAGTGPQSQQLSSQLRVQAEQGDVTAQRKLGMAYDSGQGVPRDLIEAARWYTRAAEQGDAIAQNNLGSLYLNGEGVEKDHTQAAFWFKKSADQKNAMAQNSLGLLYDEGRGVAKDKAEAVKLYTLSAEQGYTAAMLNLGILYSRGDGVPKDLVQAYMWWDLARFYTQSAPANHPVKWRVRKYLDELKSQMSKEQIQQGDNAARSWEATHRR